MDVTDDAEGSEVVVTDTPSPPTRAPAAATVQTAVMVAAAVMAAAAAASRATRGAGLAIWRVPTSLPRGSSWEITAMMQSGPAPGVQKEQQLE